MWPMLYATCAKLLNYPDKAGLAGSELVPEVAQSLPARSADGKTYTFTIRSGFRFSPPSTERVTAQTFKHAIERTLNPAMKSPAASEAADIVGAGAYMAGKAAHIAGVTARANTLTIRLTDPAPNLPTRLAQPPFCAVPSNTPIDAGHDVIPSAGPYRVASFTPNQGVVLTRNPNYHGSRPHRLARIELAVGIPGQRAIAQVEAGTADYAMNGAVDSTNVATARRSLRPTQPGREKRPPAVLRQSPTRVRLLRAEHPPAAVRRRANPPSRQLRDRPRRAGPDRRPPLPAARPHRSLPAARDPRPRQRAHLPARPGPDQSEGSPRDTPAQPPCSTPAIARRSPSRHRSSKTISPRSAFGSWSRPSESSSPGSRRRASRSTSRGWAADYPDPGGVLDPLLENSSSFPPFDDPSYRAKLRAAARLSGPERYLAYARLDRDLVRNAAPLAVYDNPSSHELFSARMGCQTYGFYGADLGNLCVRKGAR